MRLKSFYADSLDVAMNKARHEFGPEAMIVSTRETVDEVRSLGAFEVVAALEAPLPAPAADAPLEDRGAERLARELSEMRRDLDKMRKAIFQNSYPAGGALPEELDELMETMRSAEVRADLMQEIARALLADPGMRANPRGALQRELLRRFTVNGQLGKGPEGPRVVALVGPPGAGKTTSVVKLALAQGLRQRKSVQLLTTDTCRVAAAEQLRSYAAILGVGFQVAENAMALEHALRECRAKDLVLIDNPGLAAGDFDLAEDMAKFFRSRKDIDVQLCLSASMKPADLSRVSDTYQVFQPGKLLFTRLDETDSYGGLFSEAVRCQLPLSYFGTGQQIPEDLLPASTELVLDLILNGRSERLCRAA